MKFPQSLAATFGLDVRSLFVLRVSLALMIWVDLWIRVQTVVAHYTDEGVLPRALQQTLYLEHYPGRFSLHMLSGEVGLQLLLFGLLALAALCVGLGYRTRLALFVAWLLMISLHNRNEMIETGGDTLLRMMCFWALFLPLNAVLSLDARAGRVSRPTAPYVLSWGSFGFILQLCLVYWFSAIHKDHAQWRSDFTAVHYALHIDSYATPFGVWLRQFRGLTRAMTVGVLGFEFLGPFLIFGAGLLSLIPGLTRLRALQPWLRTLGVVSFIGLHVGLGLGLSLGTFAWFAVLIWLTVLPSEFWERVEALRLRKPERWRGLARLTQPGWAEPSPATVLRRRMHYVASALALVSCVLVVLLNLRTVNPKRFGRYLDGSALLGIDLTYGTNALRLDQHWGLFAPYPRTRDGWFVLLGTTQDGVQVNLLRPDEALSWEPPARVAASYQTFRWRKYYRDLRRSGARYSRQRPFYLAHFCGAWNATHPEAERVQHVELFYMERQTRREGGHTKPEKISLASGSCEKLERMRASLTAALPAGGASPGVTSESR